MKLNVEIEVPKGFYVPSELLIELTNALKVSQLYQSGQIVPGSPRRKARSRSQISLKEAKVRQKAAVQSFDEEVARGIGS
jgi:hypothetical protein